MYSLGEYRAYNGISSNTFKHLNSTAAEHASVTGTTQASLRVRYFNLKTAVGSQKSTQSIDAHGNSEKSLITNKVITSFSDSPCTPMAYASFLRPTAVFRLNSVRR
jgi:hypothetical protein